MSNTRIIEIPATMQTGKGKNHAIRKLRVAAYCRVSTEEEEQQSSFETQMLTARIIEKIIVKSRQDLEIIFIGGYTQQISLQ